MNHITVISLEVNIIHKSSSLLHSLSEKSALIKSTTNKELKWQYLSHCFIN